MDVNLEYYKIFYYVAKYQSITLAAEKLSISQPAVSQAVKHLESGLGCEIFVRTSKGMRLTSEGDILFSYIERGYESMMQGEKKLLELLNLESGEICIGASDMTLRFYLLSYLEKFHEEYPKIKIRVTNAPTPETISHLSDGKIDFGIVSTPFSIDVNYQVTQVRGIQDIFVAGRNYEIAKNRVLSYQELEKLPIICLESNTSTRTYVDAFLREKGIILKPEFELATSDMLIQFATRNLGVASIVSDFAEEYLDSGELFQLKFEEQIPKREICIISNEKIPMSTAAKRLLELLINHQRDCF